MISGAPALAAAAEKSMINDMQKLRIFSFRKEL